MIIPYICRVKMSGKAHSLRHLAACSRHSPSCPHLLLHLQNQDICTCRHAQPYFCLPSAVYWGLVMPVEPLPCFRPFSSSLCYENLLNRLRKYTTGPFSSLHKCVQVVKRFSKIFGKDHHNALSKPLVPHRLRQLLAQLSAHVTRLA